MNDTIAGVVVVPDGFSIKSKADAKHFLDKLVGKGSRIHINDLNDPKMFYIIDRSIGDDNVTRIAHERKGKNIFEPDFMYDGEKAVALVYKGRKSINERFFSAKARGDE